MEDVRRYVSIAYIILAAVFGWVMMRTMEWVLEGFGPTGNPELFADIRLNAAIGVLAAVALGLYGWRSERAYGFSTEVAVELSKVTWPTADETKRSTATVIGFAAVLGCSLAVMDLVVGKGVMGFLFTTFAG